MERKYDRPAALSAWAARSPHMGRNPEKPGDYLPWPIQQEEEVSDFQFAQQLLSRKH